MNKSELKEVVIEQMNWEHFIFFQRKIKVSELGKISFSNSHCFRASIFLSKKVKCSRPIFPLLPTDWIANGL